MNPGNMKDQLKMVQQIKKAQKELKKELIEVEAGEGAVVVRSFVPDASWNQQVQNFFNQARCSTYEAG